MGRIHKFAGTLVPPPGRHRPLRMLLFLLLILTLIWAYTRHFDRRLEQLNATSGIKAPEGVLNQKERARLLDIIRSLRQDYGIRVHLEWHEQDAPIPQPETRELWAVIGPDTGQCRIILPHLVRRSLPPESETLYAESLSACLGVMPPGLCLERFLLDLQAELR